MSVVLQVADDWFNAASPSRLAFDGGRLDPSGLTDRDVEVGAVDLVAAIPPVDICPFHSRSGKLCDLINLVRQCMAVIGAPGRAIAPRTNCPPLQRSLVVAIEVLTPNSYLVRALPLPIHSTSGACRA